jgi:hypothetical protein
MKYKHVFALALAVMTSASVSAHDITELEPNQPASHFAQAKDIPFFGWYTHQLMAQNAESQPSRDPLVLDERSNPVLHAQSQNIPLGGWNHREVRVINY